MKGNYIFTSESVSAGHPDKVADQISDAILDAGLADGDETTRIAVETMVTTNHVTVAGEVKGFSLTNGDIAYIIRQKVREIGYEQPGFHWRRLRIKNLIHQQSADIALGTDDFGAGDQGIMFGYACRETPSLLPAPIHYAHAVLKKLRERGGRSKFNVTGKSILGPDAKAQISVEYRKGKPIRVDQVVISSQHVEGRCNSARVLCKDTALEVLGDLVDSDTVFHLNPTGNFVIGGPDGDVGLTGRKIIVDTYGGYAPHGGGAFSGKDPTKVDRSAAYMSRWLAKNAVASGMADWCQIQLSYAIGVKEPTSIYVDSNGNSKKIQKYIRDNIDLTPKGIIDRFDLFNFVGYSDACVYGHFGDPKLPWEKIGW